MTKEEMKIKGYYALFGECYSLLGKSQPGKMDWDFLVKEADRIGQRWKGTDIEELAYNLINDVIKEMEKKF